MAVLSLEAAGRRTTQLVLPVFLALLALPLMTAAHHSRPVPYGDRLTVHARVQPGIADTASAGTLPLRMRGRSVQAYDPDTGRARWTYTREGRRPLALLSQPGHAIALWDDAMVTDTVRGSGRAVRWHRAIPAARDWLRTPGARGGAGVLRPLGGGSGMLAVVTPRQIAAYRVADGDLRWVLPARRGCAFTPAKALRHGRALIVAQPCAADTAWPGQLIAVDDLGRIAPHRKPLGNALPGTRPVTRTTKPLTRTTKPLTGTAKLHTGTAKPLTGATKAPEKVVAQPR
ncbi:PQQ-binding-like beta-propeller repeat protein [Streptomyces monticola]|uniref:PQQ-binding-like beta-propeller repeat protein n=1 Tax=Streptomyces monticola TaxID=2666263 RepID=A0ABW2JLP9_9ACTN